MSGLGIELLKGAFTLAAVALGSIVALRVYFVQKEYELTKQRHLEQGIDVVASELEIALGTVSHNYARALQVCKSFRDYGNRFDVKELDRGFIELDSSNFRQIAHYRVGSLLQSQVVWETFQAAMAYAHSANSTIASEVPDAMRLLAADPTKLVDRDKHSLHMLKELREKHDGGFNYVTLQRELHALALLLEAKRFSLKAIGSFAQRDEAKALVARLVAAFPKNGGTAA